MPSKQTIINRATKELLGWHVVLLLAASKKGTTHTLESDGTTVKCSCQGFRIAGKGVACKHTRLYHAACTHFNVAIGTRLYHGIEEVWSGNQYLSRSEDGSLPRYTYE